MLRQGSVYPNLKRAQMNGNSLAQTTSRLLRPNTTSPPGGVREGDLVMPLNPNGRAPRLRSRKRGGMPKLH